jgi:hypothetical protein
MPSGTLCSVTLDPLTGLVVVVAGEVASGAIALLTRGALLAVVTTDGAVVDGLERAAVDLPTGRVLAYRADPAATTTWERVAPHIEQRVGPVDAVVCDPSLLAVVTATFASDLRRRGHGAVGAVSRPEDLPAAVDRLLRRTP